eukprot:gene451-28709_t
MLLSKIEGTELNQAAQAARKHVRNLLAPPTVREDLDHPAPELSDCSARPRLASVYSRPLPAASIHEFLDGRAVEPGIMQSTVSTALTRQVAAVHYSKRASAAEASENAPFESSKLLDGDLHFKKTHADSCEYHRGRFHNVRGTAVLLSADSHSALVREHASQQQQQQQQHQPSGICFGALPLLRTIGMQIVTGGGGLPHTPVPCRSFKVSIKKTDGTDSPASIALGFTTRTPCSFLMLPPSARQLEDTWLFWDGQMRACGGPVQTIFGPATSFRNAHTFTLVPNDVAEVLVFDDGEVALILNDIVHRRCTCNNLQRDDLYPVVDVRSTNVKVALSCSGSVERLMAHTASSGTVAATSPGTVDTAAQYLNDGDAEQDFGLDAVVALAEHTLASTPTLVPVLVSAVSNVLRKLTTNDQAPSGSSAALSPYSTPPSATAAPSARAPALKMHPRSMPRSAARTRVFEKAERVLLAASSTIAAAATAAQNSPLHVPGGDAVVEAWGWLAAASGELRHIVRVLAALLELQQTGTGNPASPALTQLLGPLKVLARYGVGSADIASAHCGTLQLIAFAAFTEWAGVQSNHSRERVAEAANAAVRSDAAKVGPGTGNIAAAAAQDHDLPAAPVRFSRVYGNTRVGLSGEILECDPGNSRGSGSSSPNRRTLAHPEGCGQLEQALSADCPYFEVTMVDIDRPGTVTVGVASSVHYLHTCPGGTASSIGIRTVDGNRVLHDGSTAERTEAATTTIGFGPPFVSGDVLGCGMIFDDDTDSYTGVVGFTKNGNAIGFVAADEPAEGSGKFFPTIGMQTQGQSVSISLKRSWPKGPAASIAASVPLPGWARRRRMPQSGPADWFTLAELWACVDIFSAKTKHEATLLTAGANASREIHDMCSTRAHLECFMITLANLQCLRPVAVSSVDGIELVFPTAEARTNKIVNLLQQQQHANEISAYDNTIFDALCDRICADKESHLIPARGVNLDAITAVFIPFVQATIGDGAAMFRPKSMLSHNSKKMLDTVGVLQRNYIAAIIGMLEGDSDNLDDGVVEKGVEWLLHHLDFVSGAVGVYVQGISETLKEAGSSDESIDLGENVQDMNGCIVDVLASGVLSVAHQVMMLTSGSDDGAVRAAIVTLIEHIRKLTALSPKQYASAAALVSSPTPEPAECLSEWVRESAHVGSLITTSAQKMEFVCPGAVQFEVIFDKRTVLDKHADLLEFTTSNDEQELYGQGSFVAERTAVADSCLGKPVLIHSPGKLSCEFTASPSKMRWGYRFTVRALGHPIPSFPWHISLLLTGCEAVADFCGHVAWPPQQQEQQRQHKHAHEYDQWKGKARSPKSSKRQQLANVLWDQHNWGLFFNALQREVEEKTTATPATPVAVTSNPDVDANAARYARRVEELVNMSGNGKAILDTCRSHRRNRMAIGGPAVNQAVASTFAVILVCVPGLVDDAFDAVSGVDNFSALQKGRQAAKYFGEGSLLLAAFDCAEQMRAKLARELQNSAAARDVGSSHDEPDQKNGGAAAAAKDGGTADDVQVVPLRATASVSYIADVAASVLSFVMYIRNMDVKLDDVKRALTGRQEEATQRILALGALSDAITQEGSLSTAAGMIIARSIAAAARGHRHILDGVDGCGAALCNALQSAYFKLVKTVAALVQHDAVADSWNVGMYSLPRTALLELCVVEWKHGDMADAVDIPGMLLDGCGQGSISPAMRGSLPWVGFVRHRSWLLFSAMMLDFGVTVQHFFDIGEGEKGESVAAVVAAGLSAITQRARTQLLWQHEDLSQAALGLFGSLVQVGPNVASIVLTAIGEIALLPFYSSIEGGGNRLTGEIPQNLQLPLLHILAMGGNILGVEHVDRLLEDKELSALFLAEPCFLFELGARAVARNRCRLACAAAHAVNIVAQCTVDASNAVVSRTLQANLPLPRATPPSADAEEDSSSSSSSSSSGMSRQPKLTSHMVFSLWSLAKAPALFSPGTEFALEDESVNCRLIHYNPLSGACAVFTDGGTVASKPRTSLEHIGYCADSTDTARTPQLLPLGVLLETLSTTLPHAAKEGLQHGDALLEATLYLKTLHRHIKEAGSNDAELLQVINTPNLVRQIFSLARESTQQPADLLLDELQCMLAYGNSRDMEDEMHSFATPQPYINCSKQYSLREWCKLKLKVSWSAPSDVSCGWARRVAEDAAGARHVMLEPTAARQSTNRSGNASYAGSMSRRVRRTEMHVSAAEQRASQVAELLSGRPLEINFPRAGTAEPPTTSMFSTPSRSGRASMVQARSRRLSLPASVHTAAANLFAQAGNNLSGGSAVAQGGDDMQWNMLNKGDDGGGGGCGGDVDGGPTLATRGYSESTADGRGSSSSLTERAEHIAAVTAARAAASAPPINSNRFPGWSQESTAGCRLVDSPHPVPVGYTLRGTFTVPGAQRLRIMFDPRCGLQNVHLEEATAASGKLLGNATEAMFAVRQGSEAWQSVIIEGDTVQYAFQAGNAESANSLDETWGFAFTVAVETAQPRCIFDHGLGVDAARLAMDRSIIDLPVQEVDELLALMHESRSSTPIADYTGNSSSAESEYPTTDEEMAASEWSSDGGGNGASVSPPAQSQLAVAELQLLLEGLQGESDVGAGSEIGLSALTTDLYTFQEALSTAATSGVPIEDAVREALRAATQRREMRLASHRAESNDDAGIVPHTPEELEQAATAFGSALGHSYAIPTPEPPSAPAAATITTTTTTTTATTSSSSPSSSSSSSSSSAQSRRLVNEIHLAEGGGNHPARWLDWSLSAILAGLDQKSWAEQVRDVEASTPATNSSPRDRSSAMLQVVLEHPGQVSTACATDIAKGTLILQARELLVDLLASWPAAAQVTAAHAVDDPSTFFGLFCRMQEACTTHQAAERLRRAMHNVVVHGTRPLLDTLIQLSPQCIREPTSKLQIRKVGPMSYSTRDMVLRDQVYVRGASSLKVRFDPSTFTDFQAFHCDRVILASSFDLQSQRHVIDQGYVTEHAGRLPPAIRITGCRVYIKYESDEPHEERVPWAFAVEGVGVGFAEIGTAFLNGLIEKLGQMNAAEAAEEDADDSNDADNSNAGNHTRAETKSNPGTGNGTAGVSTDGGGDGSGGDGSRAEVGAGVQGRSLGVPLRRMDSFDGRSRYDRSLSVAAHSSSPRTAAAWRADVLTTLWEALTELALSTYGWKLVRIAGMLASVAELASVEHQLNLKLALPLWELFRRVYVFDSSSRQSSTSVLLRALSRLMFVVEDQAIAWGVALDMECTGDHAEYFEGSYEADDVEQQVNSGAISGPSQWRGDARGDGFGAGGPMDDFRGTPADDDDLPFRDGGWRFNDSLARTRQRRPSAQEVAAAGAHMHHARSRLMEPDDVQQVLLGRHDSLNDELWLGEWERPGTPDWYAFDGQIGIPGYDADGYPLVE